MIEAVDKLSEYLNRIEYSDSDRSFHPLSVTGPARDQFKKIVTDLVRRNNVQENLVTLFDLLDTKSVYLNCCRALWIDDLNNILTTLRHLSCTSEQAQE